MKSKDLLRHFLAGVVVGAAVASIISPLAELLACHIFQHAFQWMDVAISIHITALLAGVWMIFYQMGKTTNDKTDSH